MTHTDLAGDVRLFDVALPAGWYVDSVVGDNGNFNVITAPGSVGAGGMVTIDWSRRVCRLGMSTWGRPNTKRRAGRGWRQQVVKDAIECLLASLNQPPPKKGSR